MDIGFVWDQVKYDEVRKKHNVQFYEVVSAFEDPNSYEFPDPSGNLYRLMLIAQTVNGRILSIIYSDEDAPLYRIITAFDAARSYIDEYYKRK